MIKIDYYMSHGSPWTFLGHNRLGTIVERYDAKLNILPVNYGDIFPISGGLPVTKRPPQRQKMRLQELERWSKFLKIKLIPQPKFFPSKSQLPSLVIIASKLKNTKKIFQLNAWGFMIIQNLNGEDYFLIVVDILWKKNL